MKNYYKILGVKRDASEEEIREQWVEWMRKLHPDQHTGRDAKDQRIKEINEAYQVLKHSSTRMEYDLKSAYGHKKRRSYSLKWSIPMVMVAVILVMGAVYVKKPKGITQYALLVPTQINKIEQKAESRRQKAVGSSPSNEINQINQRNEKERKSEVRSQNPAFSDQRPADRRQEAEGSNPSDEVSQISQTNETSQINETNQINQIDQTDVELPQSPKMRMVSSSEGNQVTQTAQSTTERVDSPIKRRVVPPAPEPIPPSPRPPISVSPHPSISPSPARLIATEEEVTEFFKKYVERYNQKDLEGFFSLFSKEATQNRQSKLEDIRKVYADFFNQSQRLRYHLYDTKAEIYQNALEMKARYELVQSLKQGGDKVWKGTIKWILIRENGALRILSLEYQPQKSL